MFVENSPELLAPVDKKTPRAAPRAAFSGAETKETPTTRGAVRGEPCGGKGS